MVRRKDRFSRGPFYAERSRLLRYLLYPRLTRLIVAILLPRAAN